MYTKLFAYLFHYITSHKLMYPFYFMTFPGYAALFRHPNDVLNYCVYIIPGNPAVTDADLPYWHEKLMKEDPYISKALGPDIKIERMKAGEKGGNEIMERWK